MKKLIILALLCAPMWGASCSNTDLGGGWTCVSSVSTLHSAVDPWTTTAISATAGNLLVLTLTGQVAAATTSSVTSSPSTTWTLGCAETTTGGAHVITYYALAASTASTTITIDHTGVVSGRTLVHQFSGHNATTPVNVACGTGTASATSVTSSSITTTVDNVLLFAGAHITEDVGTAGTNYTLREVLGAAGGETRVATTAGAYTAAMNGGNGANAIHLMAFSPTAGASARRRITIIQ